MLIGAGAVHSVEFAQIVLGEFGMAPHFRRMAQAGKIVCKDNACPALLSGLQAAAMGIPFIPVRGFLGSDYLRVRKDFKIVKDPYSDEEIVVVPPLAPDLAFVHAIKGDRYGNLLLERTEDDQLLIKAAKAVVASVEELVETTELQQSTDGVFVPSLYLDAVVQLPYGAHPTDCRGCYPLDEGHIQEYLEAAQSPEYFQRYLEHYVYHTPDHDAYLEAVGIKVAAN
jgi:glutaconate CoA-transferase subunit A